MASLANASGLGLEKDDRKHYAKQTATANSQHASRSGAHYSTRTGRFNEGTAKSRGRTGSKHSTAYSGMLFHVPENEREMWVRHMSASLLIFNSTRTFLLQTRCYKFFVNYLAQVI